MYSYISNASVPGYQNNLFQKREKGTLCIAQIRNLSRGRFKTKVRRDSVISIVYSTVQKTITSSCVGLSIEQTDTSGIILSNMANRGQYHNNMDCQWYLVSPTKLEFEVTFYICNTELDADFLYVYDGDSSSSPLIGNFSGSSLPAPITSSSQQLYLNFKSDGSGQARGFTASYRGRMHLHLRQYLTGNDLNFDDYWF